LALLRKKQQNGQYPKYSARELSYFLKEVVQITPESLGKTVLAPLVVEEIVRKEKKNGGRYYLVKNI
jgi:nicotinamide riboside kinase